MASLELEAPNAAMYGRPAYAGRFRCITSACEDTCCNGWTIPIDRRTVELYREHAILKPFSALLVLNNENPSSGDFARMPLTHRGTCAFLTPEKLCGIHRHLGEQALSVACNTFPRETSHHLGAPETALNLSCPEAARLTLLDPYLLDAWRGTDPGRYTQLAEGGDGFDPVLAVRELMLMLLTDRRHPLHHRLALMGAAAGSIEGHEWARENPNAIRTLLRAAASRAALPCQSPAPDPQLGFVQQMLDERLAQPPVPQRFLECVEEFDAGVAFARTASTERAAVADYLDPFLACHPYLLENYLANHIFKYSYPFSRNRGEGPAEAHLYLVALAAMAEGMLFGLACRHGDDFSETHAIKLIQSLSKAIEHRAESRSRLVDTMRSVEARRSTG